MRRFMFLWAKTVRALGNIPSEVQEKVNQYFIDHADELAGQGVAKGGYTNQVLVKKSDKDYDTEWKYTGEVHRKVYSYRRSRDESNPNVNRITYLDDCASFAPFTYNFTDQTYDYGGWKDFIEELCRPVMVKYDGTVDYELNHDDTTKKLDGTDSDISNVNYQGNAMVEFRKYRYVSRITVGSDEYVSFSNEKINDTYKDYAFIDDNGNLAESFFFSMFEGSYDGTRMRSIADAEILRSRNAATEASYAKANGPYFQMVAWSQLNYIRDILTMIGAGDNAQAIFGKGVSSLSWNSGVNPFGWTVGQSKAKGCFYGESAGTDVVRTLWIEDLWGRAWDRYQGLVCVDGVLKAKMHGPYPTPSDSDVYTDYEVIGNAPNEGYIKYQTCSELGCVPMETGGSSTTYFADYFWINKSGVRFVLVGASWNNGDAVGPWTLTLNTAASYASVYIGSRLMGHRPPAGA